MAEHIYAHTHLSNCKSVGANKLILRRFAESITSEKVISASIEAMRGTINMNNIYEIKIQLGRKQQLFIL